MKTISLADTETVQTIDLQIKRLICAQLMETGMFDGVSPKLQVQLSCRAEMMAHQLTACLDLPTQVLQDGRVVASYPDGLWQSIRKALRLKYRIKEVRMNEWLVFPSIDISQYGRAGDTVRIYARPSLSTYCPGRDEE